MKRLLSVLGALVLVGAVVAVVVWQRPDPTPAPPPPLKDFSLQYADGSPLWNSKDPQTPLVTQVLAELRLQGSFQLDDLKRVAATVVTTLDPKAQAAGTAVLAEIASSGSGTLRYSLTAVDPATGGVVAYVPGTPREDKTDYAGGVLKEPGTAFFLINVAAALENGQTLDSTFDGRSPRQFGNGATRVVIRNKKNAQCGQQCAVREAFAKSVNTAMYDLTFNQVGIQRTVKAARQAGVPEAVTVDGKEKKLLVGEDGGVPNAGIALGGDQAVMRPLDLTTVYATFAAGGVGHKTHFVTKVSGEDGAVLYRATESTTSAFDADSAKSKAISDQVTSVLKETTLCPGAVCRNGEHELDPRVTNGVEAQVGHAWTVGYTGRMAITVLVDDVNERQPVKDDGLSTTIWQKFAERV
ncbi:penicillin-binding transpeptidase domain-containing protein [Lentzea sp. NPDC005914]|uniref:penicillin-binding transpeptidase domain-containing protein n=1 Tax=Lentzea sp. NPDC005914 TaxID=3154572 RepID=UPI0033FCACC2